MHGVLVRGLAACGMLVGLALGSEAQTPDTGSRPEVLLRRDVAVAIPQLGKTISVRFEGTSLDEALRTVARQAGLPLTYNDAMLPRHVRVWLTATEIRTDEALEQILRDSGLQLLPLSSGQVVVVKARASGAVAGRVTEAKTGQPVAGASVSLAGTRWRTTTGDDGRFRLDGVAAAAYTLLVRRIGYVQGTRAITVVADQEVTVDVRLEVSASPLDAVVVTGTISATAAKELPNPITIITADQIQQRGITKINDLFRGELPGVFTADNGVYNAALGAPVYVRGTTSLATYPTLKTYVDGVEIANSQYLNEIDPNMIDHVEIVRGPEAATLYGAQAINGVMQVFTKRGLMATPPQVSATLGTGVMEGTYHNGIRHEDNVQVAGGTNYLSYSVGASYQHDGAWTRTSYLNAFSGYGGLTIHPTGSPLRVDLTTRLGERTGQTGNPEFDYRQMLNGTMQLLPGSAVPSGNVLKLPQRTLGVSLHYTPRSTWQHNLTIGIDHGASGYNGTFGPTFSSPGDSLTTVFATRTERVSAQYNTTLAVQVANDVSANVTAGADYWNYYNNYSYNDFKGYEANSRLRDHSTGVFGQIRLGVAQALFLTAGARVDEGPALPADRHHRSTAPRVGVSYNLGAGSLRAKLRVGWGSALRPADPSFKRFATFGGRDVQYAAPDLKPERQNGWDGGFDLYAGDRASLSVTHYRQIARDLIQIIFPNDSAQQFVNLNRVRNTGWELEGTLRLFGGLSARGTYSEVQSIVDALGPGDASGFVVGQDLPGVPHHSGALTLSERIPRLSIEAGVEYVGTESNYLANDFAQKLFIRLGPPVFDFGLKTIPAAYRIGLRASYDVTPRITAFARVDNLNRDVVEESGFLGADQLLRTSTFGLRVR